MSSFFSLRNRRAAAVAIAAIATVALLTSACSLLGPKTVQYTDDDGRNVSIKANPQRIISMAPSNSEILFALGLGDKVVGVSNYDNYPPEAQQKEKIGDAFTPNLEKIVSLKPDLVLAPEGAATKKVEDLKIPVFILNAKKVADVLADITTVGKITGTEKKAAEVNAAIQAKLDAVAAKVSAVPQDQRPTVFWDLGGEWTVGPGSFVDDLISLAGGRNVASDLKEAYAQFSAESLLAADPDVIIVPSSDPSVVSQMAATIKGWNKLKAVKNNHVYVVDPDVVSRPGPRIADGVMLIAQKLYPDSFK